MEPRSSHQGASVLSRVFDSQGVAVHPRWIVWDQQLNGASFAPAGNMENTSNQRDSHCWPSPLMSALPGNPLSQPEGVWVRTQDGCCRQLEILRHIRKWRLDWGVPSMLLCPVSW